VTGAGQQANRARGEYGERRAAQWYIAEGYEIVARNWRNGRSGEIDLVARRGQTLVICEVKARRSDEFGSPAEAITPTKQKRLYHLGMAFLREHEISGVQVRFDVVAVTGTDLEVYQDAF
jgi:putative endonuclease